MDLNSLRDQVSNLSLYDLKAGVRKVQNAVMNFTEMESKVREATNNEPWGASSSLMQEIANGTFNYQTLNEIMPMIYKRFTEKAAEEWRQIYKALQLLEFLVKHGSERVIDDVRSHLSLLKMLRQFHYIDQNGKDQGLNVRNRSKELTDLMSDVDRIRVERKKARASKGKYGGVEGGPGMGLGGSGSMSSGRYGGFGSESASYGGSSSGVYGDGGGFGGQEADEYDTGSQSRRERHEEYDEYDEGGASAPPARRKQETNRTSSNVNRNKAQPPPPKPKEPEIDLLALDDDTPVQTSTGTAVASSAGGFGGFQTSGGDEDDDFDDFQSATPSTQAAQPAVKVAATPSLPNYSSIAPPASTSTPTPLTNFAAPKAQQSAATKAQDFSGIFSTTSPMPSTSSTPVPSTITSPNTQARPTGYQPSGPNYFTSITTNPSAAAGIKSPGSGLTSPPVGGASKPKSSGDAFANLLGGSSLKSKTQSPGSGLSMQEMAKQKASAGLWGTGAASSPAGTPSAGASRSAFSSPAPQQQGQRNGGAGGGALDDLLG